MFSGLSAFPLTPLNEQRVDEAAFVRLMGRLSGSGVNSICALGSTGSYAYLTRTERARIAKLAVQNAGSLPVIVGIGSLRTRDVIELAQDAQKAGARGLLLAPMSYQKLTPDEVFSHYQAVAHTLSVPLCVYDNPATTNFAFSDDLHGRIAQLPNVASIKIPAVPSDPAEARARVERLRALLPAHVSIGVSGDASAAVGVLAGCDAWYSVIAGLFPHIALDIMRSAKASDAQEAKRLSDRLAPIWTLFGQFGSARVIATAAELCGLTTAPSLPLPVKSLDDEPRRRLHAALIQLELTET